MLAQKLRTLAEEVDRKRRAEYSESFIYFIKERAEDVAMNGMLEFSLFMNHIPWSETEMLASFSVLQEEGFKCELKEVDAMTFSLLNGKLLKISW